MAYPFHLFSFNFNFVSISIDDSTNLHLALNSAGECMTGSSGTFGMSAKQFFGHRGKESSHCNQS